jgi:hypothetical protein
MAEVEYKIRSILENGNQETLNYILYLQGLELRELNTKQKCDLADLAAFEGNNAVKYLPFTNCSAEELAFKIGVKDICYIKRGAEKNSLRAYYEPDTSRIFINNDSIEKMMKILKYYELNYFNARDILRMHILHEVFHHIEEKFERRVDTVIKRKINTSSNFEVFRDIAAFSFVNTYEKTFTCQITDFLWKCYFYPDSIDSMYNVMIDYMR